MLNYNGQFKLRYDEPYPLLLYVANNWLKHTQKVRYESDLDGLITSLFSAGLPVQWCLFFRLCHGEDQQSRHALTPLYIMSRLGLYQPMKKLLESGVRMSTREGSHRSAFQVASLFSFESLGQLLLDRGADINIKGGCYGSTLQAASLGGDKLTVQLLLHRGADVNIKGGQDGTALQADSSFADEIIVQLLLDHGADVNIKVGQWGSALQAAAITSRESIVQLLLDYGADVNAQGIDADSALTIASSRNYSKVVSTSLDHGANINIVDERWARTPIQAVLRCRHVETSVMLLEYGAILD